MTTEAELNPTDTEGKDTDLSQTDTVKKDIEQVNATPQEIKQREIVKSKQTLIDEGRINHSDLAPWLQERTTPKEKLQKEVSPTDEIYQRVREDMEYEKMLEAIPSSTSKEQVDAMNAILADPDYSSMKKTKLLKFAMTEAGLSGKSNEAVQRGIEIGRGRLIVPSNYEKQEVSKTDLNKIEDRYLATLPKAYREKA